MLRLKFAKLLHERIVFAIGNLGILLQIIEVVVMPNFVTQLLNRLFGRSCRQGALRRIKQISRPSIVTLKCATYQTVVESLAKFFADAQRLTVRYRGISS